MEVNARDGGKHYPFTPTLALPRRGGGDKFIGHYRPEQFEGKRIPSMKNTPDLAALFAAIDRKDTPRFAEFLAPDCVFRFGNGEPVTGRDAVAAAVDGFFGAVAKLSHTLANWWPVDAGAVCHGTVRYTRHDGSELEVPFSNVFYLSDQGLIRQYLIFADNSALFSA